MRGAALLAGERVAVGAASEGAQVGVISFDNQGRPVDPGIALDTGPVASVHRAPVTMGVRLFHLLVDGGRLGEVQFVGRVPEQALPALQQCASVIAPLGIVPTAYMVDGARYDYAFDLGVINAGRLTATG